jgi:hypothetical protein
MEDKRRDGDLMNSTYCCLIVAVVVCQKMTTTKDDLASLIAYCHCCRCCSSYAVAADVDSIAVKVA